MKTLIIAPHPDDELLGCFTQLWNDYDLDIIYVSSGQPHESKKREIAIIEVIKELRKDMLTRQYFLREGDRKLINPALTLKRIQGIIDHRQYDHIFYAAKEGGHPLHDEVAYLMHFIDVLPKVKMYVYPIYGKWTWDKFSSLLINQFIQPEEFIGHTPKLEGKYMIHKLTEMQSDYKWAVLYKYRQIAESPGIRINPYVEESCRRVK
jgi:hypothetical protein